MKIRDVLTLEPQSVSPDATLMEAASDMKPLDVGILPDLRKRPSARHGDLAVRNTDGGIAGRVLVRVSTPAYAT